MLKINLVLTFFILRSMNKMLTSRACACGLFFIACIFALISCSDNENRSGEESKFVFMGNAPVIFSEIHAANAEYEDEFGEKPGWVEFYNPADTAVNLKGYSLANASDANGDLWTFGDVVVQPLSYLTVFFSGRDRPNLSLPSDSIDLIESAAYAYNRIEPPDHNSTAQHRFLKNTGLSGTLVNNLYNEVWPRTMIVLCNSYAIDVSKINQILLRGYLKKNFNLRIDLVQEAAQDYRTWYSRTITGTGKENDFYIIELPSNSDFSNFRKINELHFSTPHLFVGDINFSFSSIVAKKREGDIHVSFELNESGGKLFLIDSRQQIRDSVVYPAAVRDLSFAKNFEILGGGQWTYSKPPTPNSANSYEFYEGQAQQISEASIPKSGYFLNALSFTLPTETEQGIIRCDTSGAIPNESSVLKSGSTLNLTKTAVLRCVKFKQGAYPSEPILRTYIIGERLPSLPVVSIAVNPIDMFDSTIGIYTMGQNETTTSSPYFGANFWGDTELPIQMDFFENGAKHAWSYSAGIQIFGGWTRSRAKKSVAIGFRNKYGQKNLSYPLFPEHPNLTKFNWFILRNNGGGDNDYIRDMLMTSLTEGLGIDYQKGRSVIVYYNGKYFGIYQLRERSNADYFDTNYGIDENDIDLVKVDNMASRGSDTDYQDILKWLGNVTLDDENLEQLKRRIDLDNYTNYFQSEIYFKNTDWILSKENNLKRWRSRNPVSKWKWFLYDTDSSNKYPQTKMLNLINQPHLVHLTLIIRKLLKNQNYKNAFINRFSLLLATYYAPARVETRINALMRSIESEIPLDQQRWNLNVTYMDSSLTTIRNFGKNRPAEMQNEIKSFFELGNSVDLTLTANGNGKILVHNLPMLKNNATFKVYSTVPITIKAVPNAGAIFSGWSDGNKSTERTITIEQTTTLKANFF